MGRIGRRRVRRLRRGITDEGKTLEAGHVWSPVEWKSHARHVFWATSFKSLGELDPLTILTYS
jgi:hypothetical protein